MQHNEHVYTWLGYRTALAEMADLLSDAALPAFDPTNHAARLAALRNMTRGQLLKFAGFACTALEHCYR